MSHIRRSSMTYVLWLILFALFAPLLLWLASMVFTVAMFFLAPIALLILVTIEWIFGRLMSYVR